MDNKYLIAIILTLLAGMSTVLGGFLTFFVRRDNMKALSIGLGFSAGVMIYVSLTAIMLDAQQMLGMSFSAHTSSDIGLFDFFAGIEIATHIDYFIPDHIETELFSSPP